jgi:hypothetical protein
MQAVLRDTCGSRRIGSLPIYLSPITALKIGLLASHDHSRPQWFGLLQAATGKRENFKQHQIVCN